MRRSNRIVAFNLYFGYVGLRGFPYTDAEYIDKMDAVIAWFCCRLLASRQLRLTSLLGCVYRRSRRSSPP